MIEQTLMNLPECDFRVAYPMGSIIVWIVQRSSLISVLLCGEAPLLTNAVDESDGLTQAIEIQQVWRGGRWIETWRSSVVGPTHSNDGAETVGELDDDIRVRTSMDADNLDLLTA
jgi:hypothetical protein